MTISDTPHVAPGYQRAIYTSSKRIGCFKVNRIMMV